MDPTVKPWGAYGLCRGVQFLLVVFLSPQKNRPPNGRRFFHNFSDSAFSSRRFDETIAARRSLARSPLVEFAL